MKELQDRGTPFIRRWVACDRRLIDPHGAAAVSPLEPSNLAAADNADRQTVFPTWAACATTADGDLPSSRG